MGRRQLSIDAELDHEIFLIQQNLKYLGIKNVSKADAIRYILMENKAVQLKVARKPKTKKGVVFF